VNYEHFFRNATGNDPYPYQVRMTESPGLPTLLKAPTGAGKTEAIVLAWLWRRLEHPEQAVRGATPRRLVYCLPMRTLVEQTRDRAHGWLSKLGLSDRVLVTILMGGEERDEWWLYPEQERIIIGTQDMLISRALNRGYAASPFHWPIDFGLLNNDCLWVLDEVQLMANGLPTTTQLAAFRQDFKTYGPRHTLWMSATVHSEWLHTVDSPAPPGADILSLDTKDFQNDELERRRTAVKLLHPLELPGQRRVRAEQPYDYGEAAAAILDHHQPGGLTLAVFNTVGRAQGVFQALREALKQAGRDPELVLVHSRFRSQERRKQSESIGQDPPAAGRIVVSTQAIEAGVDLSARTLITDLAPWPSLVQRFGRCNRRGESPRAEVYWLDLPDLRRHAWPYQEDSLLQARAQLEKLEGRSMAPANLPEGDETIRHEAVLRRRDLVGLFDTTPDLSGNYLDVSRFVRGSDEMDVQVFWREWEGRDPPDDLPQPQREELCSVPVGQMKGFLSNRSRPRQARRWDYLDGRWRRIDSQEVRPGQTLLLRAEDGGYTTESGWDGSSTNTVSPPQGQQLEDHESMESIDSEHSNTGKETWVNLRDHSSHVRYEANHILDGLWELDLPQEVQEAVLVAAHYHDLGKAHPVFQDMLLQSLPEEEQNEYRRTLWAKSNRRGGKHSRPHFRHEVASALALLQRTPPELDGWSRELAVYLALAHHGKVRLSIRSLPSGNRSPHHQYLLGFPMDGKDTLPTTDLGGDVTVPQTEFDLSIAHLGITEDGEPSWLERALALWDRLGLFRLAYLEALVRAADVRATIKEQRDGGEHHDQ